MAQRTVLIDDIDGGEASETLVFGLDGSSYEIDLNDENAAQLREDLADWIAHARQHSGARGRRGGRRAAAAKVVTADNASIRSWAKSSGLAVSDRGRIPAEIIEAYNAAH